VRAFDCFIFAFRVVDLDTFYCVRTRRLHTTCLTLDQHDEATTREMTQKHAFSQRPLIPLNCLSHLELFVHGYSFYNLLMKRRAAKRRTRWGRTYFDIT
jgi:hypothetical protein